MIAGRREALRTEIYNRIHSINVKLGEFRELRKELQWTEGVRILAQKDKDAAGGIAEMLKLNDYTDPILADLKTVDQVLKDEEAAYQAVLGDRAARHQRRKAMAWGGGALLLSAGTLLAFKRRRQGLPVREALPRPAPTPALPMQTAGLIGEDLRVTGPPVTTPFGRMFPAMDLRTRQEATVKQLDAALYKDEKAFERLLACCRRIATLKHRHVVEIRAVIVQRELIHLVAEPIRGKPLSALIVPGRPAGTGDMLKVLIPVIKAVHHAHDNGMLHGDLTPASIHVSPDGTVKVMDFMVGIEARRAVARLGFGEIGTPAYLAPEQELGESWKESDFFSFGVILYEMAAGRRPFEGPDTLAAKRARRCAPIPALQTILSRTLHPDPKQRYHDALELLEDVERLEGAP